MCAGSESPAWSLQPRALMDTRQLRYFVQIVESGSLSKASRQLFVAQPALSAHVARLEQEVGKPLLVRSVRGVVPTENGLALYQHAKFVLRQLDEAVFVARQEQSAIKGRVKLGLAPSSACLIGLPLLKHLRATYPGISLNVVAALPAFLEDMARAWQLDVAVLFNPAAANELTSEPLMEEDVFVVLPLESGLVPPEKTSLTLAEVAALPLVLSSTAHHLRRRLMLEFERARLKVEPVVEVDSLLLVLRHVLEGGGATLQPMAAVEALGAPERWRCLPIIDAPMPRSSYLFSLPPHKISTSASVVATELAHVVRELVGSGRWRGVRLADMPGHDACTPTPSGIAQGT